MADTQFPYETRLNILFNQGETIDEKVLADACDYKWYTQTLCRVKRFRGSARRRRRRVSLASARAGR